MYYSKKPFTPRKPVKTFRDLEIYQKTIECAVLISKDVMPHLVKQKYQYAERLTDCAMSVPLLVAEAHSLRFADFALGVGYLEKAMASANKMVVYLEHAKGLFGSNFDRPAAGVERALGSKSCDTDLISDLIQRYADCRTKMFHLEKSWKRFRTEYGDEAKGKGEGNFKY
jgi:hypothetical protein